MSIMGLVFIPLYVKYLGIESYGLIGLFGVLQTWLGLLDLGMTPALSREMARFTGGSYSNKSILDLLRSVEIIVVAISVMIVISISLSDTWLASSWLRVESLPVPVVANAFTIMGVVIALRFVEGIYRSSLSGLQQQVFLNILNAIMSTIKAVGAIAILIWVSPTIEAFFLWQGFMALISLTILAIATYSYLPKGVVRGNFSTDAVKSVWTFAGGMMGITLLALLLTTVDKIILAKILSLSEYGYFTLASIVAGSLYMVITPITTAWFPRLCQLKSAGDYVGLIKSYHQGAQLVCVVAGSAAFVVILNAETLLKLWTQDSALAERTAPLLRLLVAGNLLNSFMWMPYQCQLAYGWTGLGVRINMVSVVVIVPAIFWATERYGSLGAAWVWVALNAGYCLIGIHFMYRRILQKEKWHWYRYDIMEPIISAAMTALFIEWLIPNPDSAIGQIAAIFCSFLLVIMASGLAAKELRKKFLNSYKRLI